MAKRLTASEYMIMLYTMFMFVLVAGAFLYGFKMGTETTTAKYLEKSKVTEKLENDLISYDQDHLITLYFTVYTPFRTVQKAWFDTYQGILLKTNTFDDINNISDIAKSAKEKLSLLKVPSSSPLLVSAQQNYLKSLTIFEKVFKEFKPTKGENNADVLKKLESSASFVVAANFSLQAQQDYFDAVIKWNEKVSNKPLNGVNEIDGPKTGIALWNVMNLNVKNAVTAHYLHQNKVFSIYMPQDLTINVESLLQEHPKTNIIQDIMDSLIKTNAVRNGDFIKDRTIYYSSEVLPQIPFFSKIQ